MSFKIRHITFTVLLLQLSLHGLELLQLERNLAILKLQHSKAGLQRVSAVNNLVHEVTDALELFGTSLCWFGVGLRRGGGSSGGPIGNLGRPQSFCYLRVACL